MARDEFDAFERWFKQKFPVELSSGHIASINGGSAKIYIGGYSNLQDGYYNPSMILNPGDECVLARTKRTPKWSILGTIIRPVQGAAENTRETPNNKAGGVRFTKVQDNSGVAVSCTENTAYTTKYSDYILTNGGSVEVIFNGYAGFNSGTNTNLQIKVELNGGTLAQEVFLDNLNSTYHPNTAVNWVATFPGPFYGAQVVNVQTILSAAAHDIQLTCFSWKLKEI